MDRPLRSVTLRGRYAQTGVFRLAYAWASSWAENMGITVFQHAESDFEVLLVRYHLQTYHPGNNPPGGGCRSPNDQNFKWVPATLSFLLWRTRMHFRISVPTSVDLPESPNDQDTIILAQKSCAQKTYREVRWESVGKAKTRTPQRPRTTSGFCYCGSSSKGRGHGRAWAMV